MTDRIKFQYIFNGSVKFSNLKEEVNNKQNWKSYSLKYLDDRKCKIKILTHYCAQKDQTLVIIEGNLRKLYFGFNSVKSDLSKSNFQTILSFISEKMNFDAETMRQFRVMNIEFGVNVELPAEYRGITNGIILPKNRYKKNYKTTRAKLGHNFKLKFYGKYEEVYKKSKFDKFREVVFKKKYVLRIEIGIVSPSQISRFNKFSTIGGIEDNWDCIGEALLNNVKSANIFNTVGKLGKPKLTGQTGKRLFESLQMIGISDKSFEEMISLANSTVGNNQARDRRRIVELVNSFTTRNEEFFDTFYSSIQNKIDCLNEKELILS